MVVFVVQLYKKIAANNILFISLKFMIFEFAFAVSSF